MISVPVPKDLARVKTKILLNLTRRQLICFSAGALIGLPLYFSLKEPLGNSGAAMCMILAMLPFFLLAMYEKNGRPLEQILLDMLRVCVLRPKQRPYRTNNPYAALRRQYELEQEVSAIVSGYQNTAEPAARKIGAFSSAGRSRQKTDPGRAEGD